MTAIVHALRRFLLPTRYLEILLVRYALAWGLVNMCLLVVAGRLPRGIAGGTAASPMGAVTAMLDMASGQIADGLFIGALQIALYVLADRCNRWAAAASERISVLMSVLLWACWFRGNNAWDAMFFFRMLEDIHFVLPFLAAGWVMRRSIAPEGASPQIGNMAKSKNRRKIGVHSGI